MKELEVTTSLDAVEAVLEFVRLELERAGVPTKQEIQIAVAVEEILVNIVRYAYPAMGGWVKVGVQVQDSCVQIRFEDQGVPFDPVTHPAPDVTLTAEEREIGGLGILMVKRTMDDVAYRHTGEKNILCLTKKFPA